VATNAYCTLADLKTWNDGLRETDEALLDRLRESASRSIDEYCGRFFWTTNSEARYFDIDACGDVEFGNFNDLVSVTEVATDDTAVGTWGTVWSSTDYQLHREPGPELRPYVRMTTTGTRSWPAYNPYRVGRIRVTGVWGWPSIPTSIVDAAVMLTMRRFLAKQSPEGVIGSFELGTIRVTGNDPRVTELLAPYRLDHGVAAIA